MRLQRKINRQLDCGSFYELSKAYNVRLVIPDKLSDLVDSVLLVRSSVLWAWGDNRAAVGDSQSWMDFSHLVVLLSKY